MRPTVFICGPYNKIDKHNLSTAHNISIAEECAVWSWNNGFNAICPHLNTRDFHLMTSVRDQVYIDFYLKLLSSSLIDMLILLPHWRHSTGSRRESDLARQLGIPRFKWTPDCSTLTIVK